MHGFSDGNLSQKIDVKNIYYDFPIKPIAIKYIEIIHRYLNSFLEIPQIKYSHIFKITYSKFVKFSQISVKGTDTAKLLKCIETEYLSMQKVQYQSILCTETQFCFSYKLSDRVCNVYSVLKDLIFISQAIDSHMIL